MLAELLAAFNISDFGGILNALKASGVNTSDLSPLLEDLIPALVQRLQEKGNADLEKQFREFAGTSDNDFNQRVQRDFLQAVEQRKQHPAVFDDKNGKKIKILTSAQCLAEDTKHLHPYKNISNFVLYCMDDKYKDSDISIIVGATVNVLQFLPSRATFTLVARTEKLQEELLSKLSSGKYFSNTFLRDKDINPELNAKSLDELATIERIFLSWGKEKSTYNLLKSLLLNKPEKNEPQSYKSNGITNIVIDEFYVKQQYYQELKEVLEGKIAYRKRFTATNGSKQDSTTSEGVRMRSGNKSESTSKAKPSDNVATAAVLTASVPTAASGRVVATTMPAMSAPLAERSATTTPQPERQRTKSSSLSSTTGVVTPDSSDSSITPVQPSQAIKAQGSPQAAGIITTPMATPNVNTSDKAPMREGTSSSSTATTMATLSDSSNNQRELLHDQRVEDLDPQVKAQYMHAQNPKLVDFLTIKPPHHTNIEFNQVFNVPLDSYYRSLFENLLAPTPQEFDKLMQFDVKASQPTASTTATESDSAQLATGAEEIIDNRILSWYRMYKSLEDRLYGLLQEFEIAQQLVNTTTTLLKRHRDLHTRLLSGTYDYETFKGELSLNQGKADDKKSVPSIEKLQSAITQQNALIMQTERDNQNAMIRKRDIHAAVLELFEEENAFVNFLHTEGYHVIRFLFNENNNLLSILARTKSTFSLNSMLDNLKTLLQYELKISDTKIAEETSTTMSSLPGLKYLPLPGDGHCLFNAVALYLGQSQEFLRGIVAANIEHNQEQYRDIIKAVNPAKSLAQYLEDLRKGIEWADNLEIAVLMKMLDRPIVVIGSDGKIRNQLELTGKGDPIFVQYNGHNHYDALILTGEKNPKEIFETFKKSIESSQPTTKQLVVAPQLKTIEQTSLTTAESKLCFKLLTSSYGCIIYQPIVSAATTFKPISLPTEDSNNYFFANDINWRQFVSNLKDNINAMNPSNSFVKEIQSSYQKLTKLIADKQASLDNEVIGLKNLIDRSKAQAAKLEEALRTNENDRDRMQLEEVRKNIENLTIQLKQLDGPKHELEKLKHQQRYAYLQFWNNPANHKPYLQASTTSTDKDKEKEGSSTPIKLLNLTGDKMRILSPYSDPIFEFKRRLQAVNAQIFEFKLTPEGFIDQRGQTLDTYLSAILPFHSVAIFPQISSNGRVVPEKFRAMFNPKRTRPANLPKIKFVETYTIRIGYVGYVLGELTHSVNLLPNEKKTLTVETQTKLTNTINSTKEEGSERQTKYSSSFEDNLQNEFSNKANISESDNTVKSEKLTDEKKAQAQKEKEIGYESSTSEAIETSSGEKTSDASSHDTSSESTKEKSDKTTTEAKAKGNAGPYSGELGIKNEREKSSKNTQGSKDGTNASNSTESQSANKNTTNSQYNDKQKSQESRENALTNALSSEGTHMSSKAQEVAQKNVSNTIRKVAQETSDNNKVNFTSSNSQTYEKSTMNREEVHLENPNNGRTVNYNFFQLQNKYETRVYLEDVKVVVCEDTGVTFNNEPLENYRVIELEEFVKMFANSDGSDYAALVSAVAAHKILTHYFNSDDPTNSSNSNDPTNDNNSDDFTYSKKSTLTLTDGAASMFDMKLCDPLYFASDSKQKPGSAETTSSISMTDKDFLTNIKQALALLKRFDFSFNKLKVQVTEAHTVNTGAFFVDSQIGLQPSIEPFLERRREIDLDQQLALLANQRAMTSKIIAEANFIEARARAKAFFQPLPAQVGHLSLGSYGGFFQTPKVGNLDISANETSKPQTEAGAINQPS